ncbi:porin [Glaciimonas sp. GNP009]|uniref:porin n=1 Tax=Glaciimonas sp. CA11.2 TaxID=3048601 RepID=UPI003A100758
MMVSTVNEPHAKRYVRCSPRVDNAIGIFSPDMSGFKIQGAFARVAVGGGTPLPEVSGNNNMHLAAEYEKGPLYIGVNYEEISNTSLVYKVKRTGAGTSYPFSDQWKLFAAVDRESAYTRVVVRLANPRLLQSWVRFCFQLIPYSTQIAQVLLHS